MQRVRGMEQSRLFVSKAEVAAWSQAKILYELRVATTAITDSKSCCTVLLASCIVMPFSLPCLSLQALDFLKQLFVSAHIYNIIDFVTRRDSCLRYRRYINHLLTYLLTCQRKSLIPLAVTKVPAVKDEDDAVIVLTVLVVGVVNVVAVVVLSVMQTRRAEYFQ